MLLLILSYFAGVLTILSPCILPVLPFVFARAQQPFLTGGLPLLAGMAVTFAGVATLAALGGGWAVHANEIGRWVALAVMAVLGLTLLIPALADRLTRPLVALGGRLSEAAGAEDSGQGGRIGASVLLGVATGLLWAPCAGPILGLVLTGAALQGASVGTTLLLLAYAAGAATSLALALLAGGRVFKAMKSSLGATEWVRRGLGAAVLVGVVLIAAGLDTGLLTRLSAGSTSRIEQGLLEMGGRGPLNAERAPLDALPVIGPMPPLDGATQWLNGEPLTAEDLRGKVVLIDFWTYSCINCVRTVPYVRAWAEKYRDQGLVVIGVHTPEFAFEKSEGNVRAAIERMGIEYPVAMDNDYSIWRAFENRYWPAHYFIDAEGNIRYTHFGEGDYEHSERVIQQLLREAGQMVSGQLVDVRAEGVEAAGDLRNVDTRETYVGYGRAENFASPGGFLRDQARVYEGEAPELNDWVLNGRWTVAREHAALEDAGGRLTMRFRARDLHLVMAPGEDGRPVRFRVTLDGEAPGRAAGVDIDAEGYGQITEDTLYQLIRQDRARERTFEIEFLDPGARVFAFTFG